MPCSVLHLPRASCLAVCFGSLLRQPVQNFVQCALYRPDTKRRTLSHGLSIVCLKSAYAFSNWSAVCTALMASICHGNSALNTSVVFEVIVWIYQIFGALLFSWLRNSRVALIVAVTGTWSPMSSMLLGDISYELIGTSWSGLDLGCSNPWWF